MKPRQFKQLLSVPLKERVALVCEGLEHLGSRLRLLASEIDQQPAGVGLELLAGVAGEEAGKALILIDIFRSPGASQCSDFASARTSKVSTYPSCSIVRWSTTGSRTEQN